MDKTRPGARFLGRRLGKDFGSRNADGGVRYHCESLIRSGAKPFGLEQFALALTAERQSQPVLELFETLGTLVHFSHLSHFSHFSHFSSL